MRKRNLLAAIGIVFVFLSAFASSARAQGVIVPIICDRHPRCPAPPFRPPRPIVLPLQLPVKSIKIETKINAQVATTHVVQVFRNDTDAALEGTYFFPIPETASISEFAIWENDKRLAGEVRSREEARRIYESIVRRQRDPGLLEYAGKDLFQATIFPIAPRSDKKLEITYTQVLKAENGTIAYRYPLGTNSQGWANVNPSEPIPMTSEDAGLPNYRKPTAQIGSVSGTIEITNNTDIRNVYSPSHSIEVTRSNNRILISFESSAKSAPQDFQLFYAPSPKDFGMSLLTYREPNKDGYFLLILSPKDKLSDQELAAKDVCFVLDTSGSMADEGKIDKARSALLFGIRGLRANDRFNVVNFAGEEHLMENSLIEANAAGKKRGEEFVKNLMPSGGTNINDALRAALKQFNQSERPKIIVFLTDGLPTVGETKASKIVENARETARGIESLHLFTFGVGYDVNTQLLDQLAAENGGTSDYVEPKEDIEIKVSNFFAKVNSPVLTDLTLDFGGLDVDLVYPRKLPDLFKGSQLTLIGRYRNPAEAVTFTLRGRDQRDNKTFAYQNLAFPNRNESNDFLPRLWATRRVGWLLEQIRAAQADSQIEPKELRDEIVELGTRYGIVTPYTSYLATDGTTISDRQIQTLPLNGRRSSNLNMLSITKSEDDVRATSGAAAVRLSKKQNAQQTNVTVSSDNKVFIADSMDVRKIGPKTFYHQNGFWQDAEFKAEAALPEVKLRFASDEYFNLLRQTKELAQYFALGEQIIVVYRDKVYRVVK